MRVYGSPRNGLSQNESLPGLFQKTMNMNRIEINQSASVAADTIARLERSIQSVIRGKNEVIQLALVTLFSRGHLLIEDVPGVGKTTLAHALARSLGLLFQRIQFTSDLLPADILGNSI